MSMIRAAVASSSRAIYGARAIHSTPAAYKTVTDKVSEVASSVNKKVGEGLASAIETGEQVTEKTKETVGSASQDASKKANETAELAGQKGNQAAAGARKATEDFKNEVKK